MYIDKDLIINLMIAIISVKVLSFVGQVIVLTIKHLIDGTHE